MPSGKPTSSQSDLTLLVQQEGRIDREVFLQHGITIGRAASNTVCIDDSEVEHIHARVLRQADGSFILQAEDRATFQAVSSEDGTTQTTDKAALQADLVLQIGKTKIICRQQQSHTTTILADSLWEAACSRCQSIISDQAETEHVCSTCSLPLFRHESEGFTGWLPRKVGPYEIRKFVAKGGMGVVLQGVHEKNEQLAAIKLPHPELVKDEKWVRRFEGEIKTLARLVHPNLVRLQGSGREESLIWLAMDWVEGQTLSARAGSIQRIEVVRSLMGQVLKGLARLHEIGIVHRDLKPANLLLGNKGIVKLADFGLAKLAEGEETMLTRTGKFAGSGPYMAPEQWQGLKVSEAADVYALGIIWHELLTGKRPALGKVSIDEARGDCPPVWIKMIKSCLRLNPSERPSLKQIKASIVGNETVGDGIGSTLQSKLGRSALPWAAILVMAVAGINYWLADRPKEQQGGIDSTVVPGEPKLEVTEVEYPVEQKPAEVVEKNDSQPNSFSGRLQDIVKQRAADGDKVAKPVEVVVQSEREPQAPAQTTTVIEQETKQKTSEAQNSVEQRPAEAGKKSDSQTNPFRGRLQDIVKQRAADGDKVAKPVEVVAQSEPEPQASAQTTTVTEQETKPGNQEAIKEVKPVEVVPQREPSPIPAPKGPGYLAWEFKTQGDVSSSPAIGIDGIVYCTSEDRKVYALDGKTGKKIWEFEASSLMKSSPAIGSDGTVYVGSLFGYLHALDGKTGAKKWAKRISTYSSCAIGVDDLLYIGSEDGHLHVFDCKTGVIKWKYRTGDWIRSSPVIGGSGEVYFVSYNNKVYSLDKSKPFKIWEHDLPIMGKVGGSFAVAYDGTLYFGATSKRIYALSGKTGELEWEFETEDWVSSSPAIGTDGTVYVGSNDGRMYALDGTTGVRKWMYQTEGSVVSSPALGDNEVVYFGSIDDYFYALDSKSGAVKWVFRTDGDVSSSPVLSDDGMIYFGSNDNWIYALKTSSKGPANSSWPMYRQNPQHTGRLPSIKQIEQTNTTTSTEHNTKTHKSQLKTQAKYKYLKPSLPNSGDRQLATSYIADGDSAKKSREWQLAKALYLKAVEADPACFDAHWELASVAHTIGETELALKSYEYAMALSPNDLPAQNNFALSLVQGNYFSDAERTLKTILELEPNHVAAHFELGRLYSEKLNDAGKAAAHYKRVIELQPKHRQEKTIRDWLVRNKTNLAVNPPPKEPKKSAAKSVPVRLDEQLNQE